MISLPQKRLVYRFPIGTFFSNCLQVVVRTQETRRNTRDDKVRQYFYGPKGNLYPHSFTVSFADIKIFKIGGEEARGGDNSSVQN